MTNIEKMNNFALTAIDNTCLALFKNDYLEAENAIKESNNIKKYEDDVLLCFFFQWRYLKYESIKNHTNPIK